MSEATLDLNAYVAERRAELKEKEAVLAFPREEYRARLDRLRAAMSAKGIDVLVLTNPEIICWLHGFSTRWNKIYTSSVWPALQATVVHVDHDRFIVFESPDQIHTLRLTSVSEDNRFFNVYDQPGMIDFVLGELKGEGWLSGVVGLEKLSPVPSRAVSEAVEQAFVAAGCAVVDCGTLTRDVRRIKSPLEIAAIEEATRICDVGLRALADNLTVGMTELEAWAILIQAMAAEGGEPGALHECVSPLGAGYTFSSRRKFQHGDYFFADPAGVYNRYHGNVARTFWIGEPTPEAVRLAEIEARSFEVLAETAKAGTSVAEVNRALRQFYDDEGVSGLGWGGGYELGLSFPPDRVGQFLFEVDEEEPEGCFEAGMVTNYENLMHVITIDTLVYEEDGARVLSGVPHRLFIID